MQCVYDLLGFAPLVPRLRKNLDLVQIITASAVILKLVGGEGREREIPVHVERHHIPRYYTLNICRIRTI